MLIFITFTAVLEQKCNFHQVFNWLCNSLITFIQTTLCFFQTLSLQPRKNWKWHWELPGSPCGASHPILQPFQSTLIHCRQVFSGCLYLDEGCTNPALWMAGNSLISYLSLFIASLLAYALLPALFCNVQVLNSLVAVAGVSLDTTMFSFTFLLDLENWVIQATSHKTGCFVPLSLPSSHFQFLFSNQRNRTIYVPVFSLDLTLSYLTWISLLNFTIPFILL